jgi:ferredoxin-NADP reductase
MSQIGTRQMATHQARLTKRREIAEATLAFHLEKPVGFQYKAGQFVNLTLIQPSETDAEGNTRSFSMASAPYEEGLMFATRLRDTAFKRVLKGMPLGTQVKIQGPFGNLTLHPDAARPAVFLTGGIGITPFRSIILDVTRNKLPHCIFLFYSNRRPEDAAFLEELLEIETQHPAYKLVATMTQIERSKQCWKGKTGYISREMLAESVGDLSASIYYLAGPPSMVSALRKTLDDVGIKAADIRIEEFEGYRRLRTI